MPVEDSSLLRSLFDDGVAACIHHGAPLLDALYPEEAQVVASVGESRRAHFTAGRLSARAALASLGAYTGSLLPDATGAPLWPEGIVGSITHTNGFCGAVVARRAQYLGIGIDAEPRGRVTEELWQQVLTTVELGRLLEHPAACRNELATVIFCAKEAFYKCQYQMTGAWLGFEGAEVLVGEGWFILRLLDNVDTLTAWQEFAGRFGLLSSLVVAGIAIAVR